ncbi:hypothetical protein KM043_003893 [Ampulex compressa]|nr:hypothetical protein KM043_003893 [Ampulex compressa]
MREAWSEGSRKEGCEEAARVRGNSGRADASIRARSSEPVPPSTPSLADLSEALDNYPGVSIRNNSRRNLPRSHPASASLTRIYTQTRAHAERLTTSRIRRFTVRLAVPLEGGPRFLRVEKLPGSRELGDSKRVGSVGITGRGLEKMAQDRAKADPGQRTEDTEAAPFGSALGSSIAAGRSSFDAATTSYPGQLLGLAASSRCLVSHVYAGKTPLRRRPCAAEAGLAGRTGGWPHRGMNRGLASRRVKRASRRLARFIEVTSSKPGRMLLATFGM